MNRMKTTAHQEKAASTADAVEVVAAAPAERAETKPAGLRSVMAQRFPVLPPQKPRLHVQVVGGEIYKSFEQNRPVESASMYCGKVELQVDRLVDRAGYYDGNLTVLMPGYEPEQIKAPLGFKTNKAQDILTGVIRFLQACQGEPNPEGPFRSPWVEDPLRHRNMAFLSDLRSNLQTEQAWSSGGPVEVPRIEGMLVIREGEKMIFNFDGSRPGAGHAVRLDGSSVGASEGRIAILGGMSHFQKDAYDATFNASAHMSGGSISCSGGPGASIKPEDLVPTGETTSQTFWRSRDGRAERDGGEYYQVDVPLWSWKGDSLGVFNATREDLWKALESIELRYPDGRKDCAYLTTVVKNEEQDKTCCTAWGFVASPIPSKGRNLCHAQMYVGPSGVYGCGVGETLELAIADLKTSLLEAYDQQSLLVATDPARRSHMATLARIYAYENDLMATQKDYHERVARHGEWQRS